MITTQNLFDVILTHIRVQGGHGPERGYDTTKEDCCMCVKGIWGAHTGGPSEWVREIGLSITRELTRKEISMFDQLEDAYETHFLSPNQYLTNMQDSFYKQFENLKQILTHQFWLNEDITRHQVRYEVPYFEETAQKLAQDLGLKYVTPPKLPLQPSIKLKRMNKYLYEELKKLAKNSS